MVLIPRLSCMKIEVLLGNNELVYVIKILEKKVLYGNEEPWVAIDEEIPFLKWLDNYKAWLKSS